MRHPERVMIAGSPLDHSITVVRRTDGHINTSRTYRRMSFASQQRLDTVLGRLLARGTWVGILQISICVPWIVCTSRFWQDTVRPIMEHRRGRQPCHEGWCYACTINPDYIRHMKWWDDRRKIG
jgi:hypothetical protein